MRRQHVKPARPEAATLIDYCRAARAVNPARLLLLTLLFFFVALILAPVTPTKPLNLAGVAFWLAAAVAAYLGLRLGSAKSVKRRSFLPVDANRLTIMTKRTVHLGAMGVCLLLIERYIIRGAPLELDFFAVREALENTSPGPLGMLAALLSAFAPFGVMMISLARARGVSISPSLFAIAAMTEVSYVLLSLAVGSRSLLLVVVILHMLSAAYVRSLQGRKLDGRIILAAAVMIISLALVSASMMLARLDQMGLDPLFSIQSSGYAETVQPSPEILAWLETNGDYTPVFAALFSLSQYLFHGFFEFNLLFVDFRDANTLGAMSLWLPAKVASILTGIDLTVPASSLAGWREGIFTTFMGPAFVDFSLFAPIFLFFLFWVLSFPMRFLAQGEVHWLPVASMVCCVVILFPVVSLLDSASGVYPLTATLVIPLLSLARRRKQSDHRHKPPGDAVEAAA